MTRKYGESDSHPIPVWNGIFDHYERIGIALWTFEWLIDRIPKDGEHNGVGRVLGGKPIRISEIVGNMRGATYKGIRRQLDTLEAEGYITRRRTPYGHVIEVRNSRKWNIWTAKESGQKGRTLPKEIAPTGQSDGERLPLQGREIALQGQNKENTAVHSSKANAAVAGCGLWKEIGVNPKSLPALFVKLCEDLYATKNGQPMGEFVGVCMDAWEALGGARQPRLFVQAAARIREQEVRRPVMPEIPELEALPWAAKN